MLWQYIIEITVHSDTIVLTIQAFKLQNEAGERKGRTYNSN